MVCCLAFDLEELSSSEECAEVGTWKRRSVEYRDNSAGLPAFQDSLTLPF